MKYVMKDNRKIIKGEQQVEIHREILESAFKISPQEDAEHDIDTQREIEHNVTGNQNERTPEERPNTGRLRGRNIIGTVITTEKKTTHDKLFQKIKRPQ